MDDWCIIFSENVLASKLPFNQLKLYVQNGTGKNKISELLENTFTRFVSSIYSNRTQKLELNI